MNNKTLSSVALTAFAYLNLGATSLQSVFLLIIRLYWGWQFFQTGMGKLENIHQDYRLLSKPGYSVPNTECLPRWVN